MYTEVFECRNERVIVLVEAYDDGTMESKNFLRMFQEAGMFIEQNLHTQRKCHHNTQSNLQAGLFVMGNAYKNTEAAIYRDFIKSGVKFDLGNSLATIKRVLYETYAPAIKGPYLCYNCSRTSGVV